MRTIFLTKTLLFVCLSHFSIGQNIGKKININPFSYNVQKDLNGNNGVVVCAHPLAAKVGKDILMQGGNAIDAAIATQFTLAVVYPGAGNIGGGGFMVARLHNGQTIALDYREMAPQKATENMYIDSKTGKANTRLSQNGHLAAGVPGTVAGIFASLKYARLPLSKLIQPAITIAERGFVITKKEAENLNNNQEAFQKNNTTLPAFYKKTLWHEGDTLIQKDLANTLKRILKNGMKEFYEGKTAQLITNEMERGGGIITLSDLKKYIVKERNAFEFDYKGYHIITMPPPSSGGIMLAQMLKMLENRPLRQYGFQTAKSVQLITEVERRSYADRAEYLGDPDFCKIPVEALISKKYLSDKMTDYDSTKASESKNIKAGLIRESEQTTHLSIFDKEGNCVSITTTLNGSYGSKTVVSGAGFFLNNEMDDFSVQPGVPNMYGAIGGKANAIAPGKRMLSSMTPTIVLKNNKPFMIVGTPGGTTIITSVLQSILNVVDYDMNAHDAVNNPKFHHQWLPDEIFVEKDFPEQIRNELKNMGYKITERSYWSRTELIKVSQNHFEATADKRGDDAAEGY